MTCYDSAAILDDFVDNQSSYRSYCMTATGCKLNAEQVISPYVFLHYEHYGATLSVRPRRMNSNSSVYGLRELDGTNAVVSV